jgi:hypothetical protein
VLLGLTHRAMQGPRPAGALGRPPTKNTALTSAITAIRSKPGHRGHDGEVRNVADVTEVTACSTCAAGRLDVGHHPRPHPGVQ